MAGPQRKTRLMTEEERRITAYHEGGHALVAAALPHTDPVHKITIMPRGRALGYTMVYGVLRFINFAHGDVYMVGAFAGYYLAPFVARVFPVAQEGRFSWSTTAGALTVMLLSMAVCAVLGIVIEKLVYRPLRSRPRLTVLITAIGVSIFLGNTSSGRTRNCFRKSCLIGRSRDWAISRLPLTR